MPWSYLLVAVPALVAARLLPFVAWALGSSKVSHRARVCVALLGLGLVALAEWRSPGVVGALVPTALAMLYLAAVGFGVHLLVPIVRPRGLLASSTSMVLCASIAMLIPALLVHGPARVVFVVRGFEFALSAHSYLSAAPRDASLRSCLVFLLVNPAVCYARSGTEIGRPKVSREGALRLSAGVLLVACHFAIQVLPNAVPWLAQRSSIGDIRSFSDYSTLLASTLCICLMFYTVHSGVAQIEIGSMRLMGFDLPPRYRFALLSSSPQDWWRRWNTYVGAWFHHHIFLSAARRLRSVRALPRSTVEAGALLTVFLVSGILHEFALIGTSPPGYKLLAFVLFALELLLWSAIAQLLRPRLSALSKRAVGSVLVDVSSWFVFVNVHLALVSFALSTFA